MRPHDLRIRTALAVVIAFAAGLYFSADSAVAQQAPTTAVCVQVPQRPDRVMDEALANWMTEQIALGRTNFESVTALSTVLCAW